MLKILLVDDVPMFVELQKGYLEPSTLKILTAQNGMEALEICRKERPDLVCMDLNMPVMDGAACCQAIRNDPQLSQTRVVLIISAGKPADQGRCVEAGCNDFLTKPLDRIVYLETARKYLPIVERRNRRVSCRFKAKFRAEGLSFSATIMDVSWQGVYLATDWVPDLGTEVELVFALPDPFSAIIQVRAAVAWLNTKRNRKKPALPEGFGLKFINMPRATEENMRNFVDAQVESSAPVWRPS